MPVRAGDARRVLRHPVALCADVTILRSGVPREVPGRLLDLSEEGAGVVLSHELRFGETVGIAFRLQPGEEPVRARAVVRHQQELRCGMEFLRLSDEGEDTLRLWALRMAGRETRAREDLLPGWQTEEPLENKLREFAAPQRPRSTRFRNFAGMVLTLAILTAAFGWWQWERGWREIEKQDAQSRATARAHPMIVAPDEMESLITHKVAPVYPEAARQQNLHGVVILRVTIGRDGNVTNVQPVSGPELLMAAAIDAVTWWRYQPYRVGGQPMVVETTVAVEFSGD